jgi:serine phosphatase RsbU (regulator of sigma subunit)
MSLNIDSTHNSKKSSGKINQNIGNVYNSLNNYPLALAYYFKAIKDFEKDKKYAGIGGTYCNIGNIYDSQKEYDNAIKNYRNALHYLNKTSNVSFKIITTINLGIALKHKGYLDSSLTYYFIALKKAKEINKLSSIGNIYSSIAVTYIDQKKYKEAENYLLLSKKISEETADSSSLAENKINLGQCYLKTKKNKAAIDNFYEGYLISKNIGENEFTIHALHGLYDSYAANNQYKEASIYLARCFDLKDSIFNIENSNALSELKTNFEVEKKENELKAKAEEQKIISAEEKKRQQFIIFGVAGILVIVIIFSISLYKRFRITNKQKQIIELKEKETQQQNVIITEQKHLVEEKHKEITDSINYAERIQRSLLANEKVLAKNLNDYFIFFKPKDVVSGDFYWASELNNNAFCLVTADSTGHGVPGAIMSMLNMNSLKEAVTYGLKEADDILNYTRKIVISTLANDGSKDGGKDGMDCSLLVFDFNTLTLHWVAANNPVWIVRKIENENELIELKPQKMPVGKHDKQNEPFIKQSIQLLKGDIIYTLTDGFPDQFGGEKGKKFMSKNLKELLQKNSHLPMQTQKELLQTSFQNWVGVQEQVDDVTVIGIKI